jgi:transcriptional regulator with XRE-family HTH domain
MGVFVVKGFGLRLENLREKYGYSKVEMSLKLGFSQNVYGAYEREEKRPSLETIIKLADIFHVFLTI